jgi:ADP-ribose pyrophosphatase
MNKPEVVYQSKRFHIERVIQTTPDGGEHEREIVRHPGAVVILPILPEGQIVFVKNYRVAVDETLIELPAGTLDQDEPPQKTAERELAEETGYRAGKIEHLLTFCMSPGILDEKMHLFLATDLTPGEAALEPGEDIEPFLCPWEEALKLAQAGEIRDAKSLVGLLFYDKFVKDRARSE